MTRIVERGLDAVVDDDRPDLAAGDPASVFASLFDHYAAPLHRYVASRIGSQGADDVVAETFLSALRHRADYDPERGTVRGWLYGIASNMLRDHLRRENRHFRLTARSRVLDQYVDGPDLHVAAQVDASVQFGAVADAIAALDPIDRDVLLLTSWAGLEPSEIAAALGMPGSTVRSRLFRVRHRLMALLTPTVEASRKENP